MKDELRKYLNEYKSQNIRTENEIYDDELRANAEGDSWCKEYLKWSLRAGWDFFKCAAGGGC